MEKIISRSEQMLKDHKSTPFLTKERQERIRIQDEKMTMLQRINKLKEKESWESAARITLTS